MIHRHARIETAGRHARSPLISIKYAHTPRGYMLLSYLKG